MGGTIVFVGDRLHFNGILHRDHDIKNLILEVAVLNRRAEIGHDLVLIAGIGMGHIPVRFCGDSRSIQLLIAVILLALGNVLSHVGIALGKDAFRLSLFDISSLPCEVRPADFSYSGKNAGLYAHGSCLLFGIII